MKQYFLLLIFVILPYGRAVFSQEFELRNRITIDVKAHVDLIHGSKFKYSYEITSLPPSQQNVWRFWIITRDTTLPTDITEPATWFKALISRDTALQQLVIDWGGPSKEGVKPGKKKGDFSFLSSSLPGLCSYYSEGYAPPPSFPAGMAPDSIPGYDDLTPYGPGIVRTTIGPVAPPSPFIPLVFLDTLISYTRQAFALGWIKNRDIVQDLNAELNNAKRQLRRNNRRAAKDILRDFVDEVEDLFEEGEEEEDERSDPQDVEITSEAYALLKFNAEYLISKL